MSTYLSIYLSEQAAAPIWGEKALLSYTDTSITLHLTALQCLSAIQKAARKIASQGICHVDIKGENWDLEKAWHFWLGFTSPKAKNHFIWSALSQIEQEQLAKRIELVSWVRDTINLPAQDLGPTALAERVVDLFNSIKSEHIHYSIVKGETLKEQGYNGLYSVGKGSNRQPVLLSVDFNPTGDTKAPVFACLVGKGITFDSGGYSLKPSNFMNSMKADMGGAALVAASLAMAIHHGLTKRVKLFLCCADNLVSGQAFKLGDIIRYRNGKSVEVNNTDAEGRLVLADGLIDAEKEHPTYIIDAATLTGAAKTALGTEYHAALSFDNELVQTLLECASEEHEHFWRLPLARFHRFQLPSAFADLSNCAAPQYSAGASTAAAFLSHFVENYQQGWLHIDCSATYQKSATDCWATGATGIGVRTLARLLKQLSDH